MDFTTATEHIADAEKLRQAARLIEEVKSRRTTYLTLQAHSTDGLETVARWLEDDVYQHSADTWEQIDDLQGPDEEDEPSSYPSDTDSEGKGGDDWPPQTSVTLP